MSNPQPKPDAKPEAKTEAKPEEVKKPAASSSWCEMFSYFIRRDL